MVFIKYFVRNIIRRIISKLFCLKMGTAGGRGRRTLYSSLRNLILLVIIAICAYVVYYSYDSRDGYLATPFVQPWIPALFMSYRVQAPKQTGPKRPPHWPYLPEFKNPCYLARDERHVFGDVLATSESDRKSDLAYPTRVQVLEGNGEKTIDVLRCLPYYLVLGWAKCGTSDMHWKMMAHPYILNAPVKEPAWFNNHR